MRDIWYLIYYLLMGAFGLLIYTFMFIGMILYYPIWRLSNKDEDKDKT